MSKIDEIRKGLKQGFQTVQELPPETIKRIKAKTAIQEEVLGLMEGGVGRRLTAEECEALEEAPIDTSRFWMKYTVNATGDDALLLGGQHKDRTVKELATTSDGIKYLRYLMRSRPPADLAEIINKARTFTETP